jgi:hypothetical protein
MNDGRARGNDRSGDDFSGGHRRDETGTPVPPETWKSFRDKVDREWRSRRSGGSEQENPVEEPATWLAPVETAAGPGPAEFSVEDFRERLLGGPGSELFGGTSGPLYTSGEHPSFGLDEENPLAAALPTQASTEYVDERFEEFADPEPGSGLVRPYFRTRGRTRPTQDLAIEALISTSEHGRLLDRVRVPEHRSICDLCLDTRSVAEVAALLRLPLGVVRVLIGDVAGLGLVLVHSGNTAVGDRPSIEFMERVLSGLRRI